MTKKTLGPEDARIILMKFTPRVQHLLAFALAAVGVAVTYYSKQIGLNGDLSIPAAFAAIGGTIWSLFQENVMQPDDATRNPGLLRSKLHFMPGSREMPNQAGAFERRFARLKMGMTYALSGLVVLFAIACNAVTPATVISDVDQICEIAATQLDPNAYVTFLCSVLDPSGNVVSKQMVNVPKADADKYGAKFGATKVSK